MRISDLSSDVCSSDLFANIKAALQLLPHVFVRPGELRYAEWADFDFDKALWTIPPHKTKMRRVHSIPLSRQALAILETIEHDADYSSYLFPSLRSVDRPMSENTINAARSEEHTSELQSLMRISYAVICLKKT